MHLPQAVLEALGDSTIEDCISAKGAIGPMAVTAGILGAKATPNVLPLCHPLPLSRCDVQLHSQRAADGASATLTITTTTASSHSTGVEMEALMAASSAALAVYDMLKAVSHDIVISDIQLLSKSGGKRVFHR